MSSVWLCSRHYLIGYRRETWALSLSVSVPETSLCTYWCQLQLHGPATWGEWRLHCQWLTAGPCRVLSPRRDRVKYTVKTDTNTFISRWPNGKYSCKCKYSLSNSNTVCQIQIQFVKYNKKIQNVNLFRNTHLLMMLLTNYHMYVKLCIMLNFPV